MTSFNNSLIYNVSIHVCVSLLYNKNYIMCYRKSNKW